MTIWDASVDGAVAGIDITASEMKALRRIAKNADCSLADLLRSALNQILAAPSPAAPTIPKGFVLVNLSESEKQLLRAMAWETGQELRGVLRQALHDARSRLVDLIKVQRVTGLSPMKQALFFKFGRNLGLN